MFSSVRASDYVTGISVDHDLDRSAETQRREIRFSFVIVRVIGAWITSRDRFVQHLLRVEGTF